MLEAGLGVRNGVRTEGEAGCEETEAGCFAALGSFASLVPSVTCGFDSPIFAELLALSSESAPVNASAGPVDVVVSSRGASVGVGVGLSLAVVRVSETQPPGIDGR